MSSPTKPTIIIIPGSFAPLWSYDPVINELKANRYPVEGIELETVGKRDKAPGLYDDAAKVAALVRRLADEGKDVVLVPHSYGGLVACEASKGLGKSIREKEGKKGGIARIVFVTAVVGREGQSLKDVFDGVQQDYLIIEGEYMSMEPVGCAAVTFSSLTQEEGLAWVKRMPNHSAISFVQTLTYPAYKDISVSYLLCEEDKCISPELQNQIITSMESQMGGTKVDRHPVKADHGINVTQPKLMAEGIMKAVGVA
ncbi:AB hydrolase-1 domain-containing protein [Favolaschia claudopus]|uniref:AB hydrolase-1 domain-containing protein n=1 Tax=Favolaschia claudopus TaxID=2862362 RepID=A0AAW0BBH1_9AGAR